MRQVTSFLGEEFELNVRGWGELGHITAVVVQLTDTDVCVILQSLTINPIL